MCLQHFYRLNNANHVSVSLIQTDLIIHPFICSVCGFYFTIGKLQGKSSLKDHESSHGKNENISEIKIMKFFHYSLVLWKCCTASDSRKSFASCLTLKADLSRKDFFLRRRKGKIKWKLFESVFDLMLFFFTCSFHSLGILLHFDWKLETVKSKGFDVSESNKRGEISRKAFNPWLFHPQRSFHLNRMKSSFKLNFPR